MCTVTFIPAETGCYITSNRDEKHWRKAAVAPQEYRHGYATLIYPKDADAGGTWIALKDNGDAAVLLNGAFKSHTPAPPYRKSRGLIFLDVFDDEHPLDSFTRVNLLNIEPFTLVLYTAGGLYECRWDGQKKYAKCMDDKIPHIWSSATLYGEEVVKRRELWFTKWLDEHPLPGQQEILDFHRFGGEGDRHNDFSMNRDGKVFTVSITSIALLYDKAAMRYIDLQNNQFYTKHVILTSSPALA